MYFVWYTFSALQCTSFWHQETQNNFSNWNSTETVTECMEDNQIRNGQCQTQEGDVLAYLSSISVLFRCPKPVILPIWNMFEKNQ